MSLFSTVSWLPKGGTHLRRKSCLSPSPGPGVTDLLVGPASQMTGSRDTASPSPCNMSLTGEDGVLCHGNTSKDVPRALR